MIIDAKEYAKLDQKSKEIYQMISNAFFLKNKKQFPELVEAMITLQEGIAKLKAENTKDIEEVALMDLLKSKGQRQIENIVTDLCKDSESFVQFAFQLRKADVKDEYSFGFLNGNCKPRVLADIVIGNKWDAKANIMTINKKKPYRIQNGQDNNILQFNKKKAGGSITVDSKLKQECKVWFRLEPTGFAITNDGQILVP